MDFNLPGLTSLPPFQLSSSSAASIAQNGAAFSASGAGDWTVNLAGSGTALQSGPGAPGNTLLFVALALGVAWLALKK